MTDQLTDWCYLVDTGASFSLVPHRSGDTPAKEPRLIGPNGLPIRCWGEEQRRLRFGDRTFEWDFLRANVSFPILGVDFLRANKLLVDVSAEHVGAALQQRTSPATPWEPLGFFSKKLDPAQVRYSTYDRELLACVQGIRHFRFMLDGPQAAHLRPLQGGGTVDAAPVPPPQLRGRVYE